MSQQVLVCDDESHITRAVSMKLTKAGFDVRTAPDGQAGWEMVQQQPPAILITDYQMPRMDGIELCRQVRGNVLTAHLPIILLTAKAYELDDMNLKAELNLTEIMLKPFSPRELLDVVQRALGVAVSN